MFSYFPQSLSSDLICFPITRQALQLNRAVNEAPLRRSLLYRKVVHYFPASLVCMGKLKLFRLLQDAICVSSREQQSCAHKLSLTR